MAAQLIGQIGLPILIKGLAEMLSQIGHPAAKGAAAALDGLNEAIVRGQMTPEQIAELNRHSEKLQELENAERQAAITQINESLRAEVASTDPYVRRMRPTFGYLIALTWTLQMVAVAFVIVFRTADAAPVIEAIASLSTIWAVGLSVLGIYVYQRSAEKKLERGHSKSAAPDGMKADAPPVNLVSPRYNQ